MAEIKIAVACHKPSELPNNPIYCPVQVGAVFAKKRMSGMAHDDEGENISAKNGSYCELTAQYWAWKNLDADYLGLCHYRRFLTFPEGNFKLDNRKQIQAGIMDAYNMERFGLLDERLMHQVVEDNDCVVGELEDITGLFTPRGKQKTVYQHWAAHDRDLINKHDLDKLIELVDEFYPVYAKDMHEYLDGKQFLGYNCFVMRRELFNQLCDFEFDILEKLEDRTELTNYNQMRTRIYGFMAEILYSVFVYHLEKTGYKVKHVPLVYFNETDPVALLSPAPIEGAIPVVINAVDDLLDQSILDVTLRSFIETCDPDSCYDVIIVQNSMSEFLKGKLSSQGKEAGNVSVRFIDAGKINVGLYDRVGYAEMKRRDVSLVKTIDIEALLPWVLHRYSRVISVEWHTLFLRAIDEMWRMRVGDGAMLIASRSLIDLSRINEAVDGLYLYARRDMHMEDPYRFFDSSVMLLQLDRMRNDSDKEKMVALAKESHYIMGANELMNSVYEGRVSYCGFDWSYPTLSEAWRKNLAPAAPLCVYRDYQSVSDPAVVQYDRGMLSAPISDKYSSLFWRLARMSPFYEQILLTCTNEKYQPIKDKRPIAMRVIDALLPAGTDKRKIPADLAGSVLSAIYPEGTRRREKIEETWTSDKIKSRLLKHMK
ncbi:DUF4422 domain-containing protein [uncultured Parolsenella sp.]|uniref:DUF4422 domain-containing protein n=1 Tax=uncultured Parolsenella sp. TaxID=2083008 RepID=UPI0025DC2FA5|nr:DUF4422 domain-containing protein [uncultured Parolsenella sp.]